jgi:hypothetical protein
MRVRIYVYVYQVRGQAVAVAVQTNFFFNLTVTYLFPLEIDSLGTQTATVHVRTIHARANRWLLHVRRISNCGYPCARVRILLCARN